MTSLDAMNADVCTALSQLAPVFMVLLVAERVVFKRSGDEDALESDSFWLGIAQITVDLLLAALSAFITISALLGIQAKGYEGTFANVLWTTTITLILLVILRWLFLATPLSSAFTQVVRSQARAALALQEGLVEGAVEFPSALARALATLPYDVAANVVRIVEGIGQFFVGVVSIGTAGRSSQDVSWQRRRRRSRGPKH
ncbi:hypothetical protein ACTJJ4_07485 [Microbacterium sp. 22195]|uniref:hypothetical protein n=1 Tax=Microbacterium sp. 22195 TaxID=3453891 RepID=UPI003F827E67